MTRIKHLFVLIFITLSHHVLGDLEPAPGVPSFIRSAVEQRPRVSHRPLSPFFMKQNLVSSQEEFGSMSLPLRSAVESIPSVPEFERIPLRDAVEYRPIEDERRSRSVRQAPYYTQQTYYPSSAYYSHNTPSKFGAFQIPHDQRLVNPQPFRAGSPYQQLVDISPGSEILLNRQQLFNEYQFTSSALKNEAEETLMGELKQNEEKYVFCYFTNWAFYRKGDGKFVPENIDPSLCTHVIYSFSSLEADSLLMKEFDPWADVDNDLYRRSTKMNIPVLLAIGGWTDSTGDKYSRMVRDPQKRSQFIQNAMIFLKRYNFYGLSFEWNYPKCWQSDCRKGPADDKQNFATFIAEMRRVFKQNGLMLGIAVSGYIEVIRHGYDLRSISANVDFMNVMAYDYHGAWEGKTGHISPLFVRDGDTYPQYNVDFTIQEMIKMGAAREKIILGVPFYGQTFLLKELGQNNELVGEGAETFGPGNAGEFTRQPGMWAQYEICYKIRNERWKVGRDKDNKSGAFASNFNEWVGFDDVKSIEQKMKYLLDNGLGGAAAWTIDLDDFKNRCCGTPFPLLKAINRGLGKYNEPVQTNCARPEEPHTPAPAVMTTVGENGVSDVHQHTTWPSWQPASTSSDLTTTTTTRRPITTTTTRKPDPTTTSPWWTTTTQRSTTTTVPTTTSPWWTPSTTTQSAQSTIIPSPVNVAPTYHGEKCDGHEHRRDPRNCNAYYRCVLGELQLQYCSGGLHWNQMRLNCDWPSNAKCTTEASSSLQDVPTTTSRRPTTTKRSTTTPARLTTTTTRRPVSTTTMRTTQKVTTTTKRTTITTKPTQKPVTTTAWFTTTVSYQDIVQSTTKRPQSTPAGPCVDYSPSKDCTAYFICINNKRVKRQCPGGLQFDAKRQICDYPENVKCVSKKKYAKLANLKVADGDKCTEGTYVKDPSDCANYFLCVHDVYYGQECPNELHFNAASGQCDWPKNAQCKPTASGGVFNRPEGTRPPPPPPEKEIDTDVKGQDYNVNDLIPVSEDSLEPLSGHYKMVCYFTNWAWYRKGVGRYVPEDINTDLCTHVVYGFAVLDYSELIIRTHDSWADIDNKFYERVSGLKSKGIKVSLALGGWNDSQGDKYSRLVRSPAARKRFVNQALEFCERFGFEGLDLDWEYPVCWQVECKKGFPDEKEGFAALVRELHEVFHPRGLLLSSAVSPSKMVIDAGYDVPALAKYLDWIAVMTYDYHGQWDKKTGHVAPLYYHPDDEIEHFNANSTMHYWMEKGAPANKLVMGMPLYGQSFQLADAKRNGLNAKAPGPGQAGEFTRAAGFLAYYEICDRIKNKGWKIVQDPLGRMGPFAYKGNQWVSYDDQQTLKRKTQLIKSMNLAGGMVWALDLDDFKNRCGEGTHPLLKVIREELRDPPHGAVRPPPTVSESELAANKPEEPMKPATTSKPTRPPTMKPTSPPAPQPIPETPEEKPSRPESTNEIDDMSQPMTMEEMTEDVEVFGEEEDYEEDYNELGSNTDFKVVCYFTNWAWYRQSGGKFLPEDIDPELCTHIVYGFAVLDSGTLTIKPHDSWADLDNNFYERVISLRKKGVKVTVAIGGWNDSAGDKYSRLVLNPAARTKFTEHVMAFIEKYGFDGLDFDWEYPVCWQVDCKKGSPEEKEGFTELIKELSRQFKPKGLLLSAAVSPNKKVIDEGYDVATLSKYFDWIAVMTYDYHGQWDKQTGHNAPMYEHPMDVNPTFNTNFTINYWLEQGADRQKIIMGMPMYGQSFSLADNKNHGLNAQTYGGGEAGDATRARGFLSYYEICQNIKNKGWHVVRDRKGRMGPYAYLRDQWVSFDDISMIRHKSQYVKAMELGGAMIWALDLDDFRNVCGCEEYPLLRTINRELRGYPRVDPQCTLETTTEYDEEESSRRPPIDSYPTMDDHPTTQRRPASTIPPSTRPPTTTQRTTTPRTTTRRTTTESPQLWEEVPEQPASEPENLSGQSCREMFKAHADCNKYYVCNMGTLMEQNCPKGLHWINDHCGWPADSNCKSQLNQPALMQDLPKPTTQRPPTKTTMSTKRPRPSKPFVSTFDELLTEKPTPPHAPDASWQHETIDSKYKVVCYFTNWAWYRPGEGKYTPDDIDANLCTHIVYGFAVLNRDTLTIKTHDSWADIDNRFYERVVEYKKKGIKVTLAIGGWNDSLGNKYSRLVLSPSARAKFVHHVAEFIEKYGFDGLDLDWEYPVCWQVECDKGMPDEKEGFASLVRELAQEFRPRGWLLSAAVSPSKMVIDKGYDVPTLAEYFDWIAVMTYDFHGHWDKQTGHVAPLYHYPGDTYEYFNANFSLHYWMEKGAPPSKLIMGMPLYGQSFSLADTKKTGLNSKSYGPGEAGEFTRAGGFLAFYEICDRINKGGWTVERDEEGRIGPYAHRGSQWVSYDDVAEIRRKSNLVKKLNLGGGMVWALDLDDFRGRCGCGNHPLLMTLNQELRGVGGRRLDNCT